MRGCSILFILLVLVACGTNQPQPKVAAAPPAPTTDAPPKPPPSVESLTIDFREASATLTPDALSKLDGAARLYRDAHPEVMFVAGHSDKSGGEFYNIMLSARRAANTKQALVDRGIPAEKLQIIAIGEAQPIPTIPAIPSAVITWR